MKTSFLGACCAALLWAAHVQALADSRYYEAFASAEAAEQAGDLPAALRALEAMQREYPNDYVVNLRLGWLHFQLQHYVEAERAYRTANEASHGSIDSLSGLGWTLIRQNRCDEGVPLLDHVVGQTSNQAAIERAQAGLAICHAREAIHGSAWLTLGASFYTQHPWKRRSGDIAVGGAVAPLIGLRGGALYRGLRLEPTDARIGTYDQHEAYGQLGYAGDQFEVLGHGAVIWSGSDVLGASRHIGVSGRLAWVGTLLLESSASFYRDLWVVRVAPAWEYYLGRVSLIPSFALQRFAQETLGAASLTVSLVLDRLSIWLGGKYGEEYRAAYLTNFAVFNAADRSEWGVWTGLRVRISEWLTLLASYTFNRLKSADGLLSDLHNLSIGTVFSL